MADDAKCAQLPAPKPSDTHALAHIVRALSELAHVKTDDGGGGGQSDR